MYTSFSKFVLKILIPLCLLIAPFAIPIYRFTFDLSTLLTVVSLLFAILVGFFIGTTTTNYLRLQTLNAQDNSTVLALYNLGVLLQPSIAKKLARVIDDHVIAALNFELSEYVEKTHETFNRMIRVVDAIRPSKPEVSELMQNLHDIKYQFMATRQELPLAARKIVTKDHWIVLGCLAGLIAFLLFMLRDGQWISALITGILTIATYLVLVLLYEIDNNFFSEEELSFQNSQVIFEAIGVLHYYPKYALQEGRVHHPQRPYRTGTFKDPANPQPKEIKTIKL